MMPTRTLIWRLTPSCPGLCAIEQFPVDVNKVDYEMLLRVPGIGVKSARLIVASRRFSKIGFYQLKKIGVVMKKAQYFITCCELPMCTVNELTPQGYAVSCCPNRTRKSG